MNKPLTLLLSAVVGAAAFAASAAALDDLVAEAGVDKAEEATAAEPNGEAGVLQAAVPSDATVTNAEKQAEKPQPKKHKEKKLTGRPAKITSDMTVYNRKEGIASFEGHVHVDDEQYQMHADRVFLFFETEKESGATVHLVSEEIDQGRILAQAKVPVLEGDTPEVLAARVLEQEHNLYWKTIKEYAAQL